MAVKIITKQVKKKQVKLSALGTDNKFAVNVSGNFDSGSSIHRDNVFFKNIKVLCLKLAYYSKYINKNLISHKIYHNIDFSWLPVVKGNIPPFVDYNSSSIQTEVSLILLIFGIIVIVYKAYLNSGIPLETATIS